jgi:hypothetical protein
MLDQRVLARIDEIVPSETTHVGFVLRDITGAVSILRSDAPKSGVTSTLPRVKREPGERPSDSVLRCLRQVIGADVFFAFPIREVWHTPNSRTFYFAGAVHDISPQYAPQLRWYGIEKARGVLGTVPYAPTRERNLAVLDRVCGMCLSPYRRVLEMVGELHRMGYERLRAPAYEYASGAWRCPVVPAAWTLKEHGGLFANNGLNLDWISEATYTGAAGQLALIQDHAPANIEFATPRDLAEEFIRVRPRIAFAGWGPDPRYAKWFQSTLKLLGPHGLYYSFAEMMSPRDSLYAVFSTVESVKLPPPGHSTEAEWSSFAEQYRGR